MIGEALHCRHCHFQAVQGPSPLSHCPHCHRRLASQSPDPGETLPLGTEGPCGDECTIGSGFDLGQELGHGGMGTVQEARQRSLQRLVAVKSLHRASADAHAFHRFHAEAVTTAYLEHPNIVPVHDLSIAANGMLLLAMKRIEGVTWKALLHPPGPAEELRAQQLTLDDQLEFLRKVCDGMAFAHARGVLHLDLKPENVMIGEYGEVLITDWGCAVACSEQAPALLPRLEQLASVHGSPAYMAPEVALRRSQEISATTDVFLLGGILYEVLTRLPPYDGTDLPAVLGQAAAGSIEPPQRRAPNRHLPEELCQLAMHALHLDPRHRPASVRAFAQRLGDCRRHASAIELATAAHEQLQRAHASADSGDRYYQRAIAFCERAIELWPEYLSGRNQLTLAHLGYAGYAMTSSAFRLAQAQASAAAEQARRSSRQDLLVRAETLSRQAATSQRRERRRRLQVSLLRLGLIWLGCLTIIGVGMAEFTILREYHELDAVLGRMHGSTGMARSLRLGELRTLAPDFLHRARLAYRAQSWADAAQEAAVAALLDPRSSEAHLLQVASLALGGHLPQAQHAADAWRQDLPQAQEAVPVQRLLVAMARPGSAAGKDLRELVDARTSPR